MDTIAGQIRLDFRSQEPIYVQIARQMKAMVSDGLLKPGDQLPTVRQLAIDLRINFSTVARAYHILDEQRLISTQRGRGTYIWDDTSPPVDEQADNQPNGQAARMVNGWIDDGLQHGLSLDEIERAFYSAINHRRG